MRNMRARLTDAPVPPEHELPLRAVGVGFRSRALRGPHGAGSRWTRSGGRGRSTPLSAGTRPRSKKTTGGGARWRAGGERRAFARRRRESSDIAAYIATPPRASVLHRRRAQTSDRRVNSDIAILVPPSQRPGRARASLDRADILFASNRFLSSMPRPKCGILLGVLRAIDLPGEERRSSRPLPLAHAAARMQRRGPPRLSPRRWALDLRGGTGERVADHHVTRALRWLASLAAATSPSRSLRNARRDNRPNAKHSKSPSRAATLAERIGRIHFRHRGHPGICRRWRNLLCMSCSSLRSSSRPRSAQHRTAFVYPRRRRRADPHDPWRQGLGIPHLSSSPNSEANLVPVSSSVRLLKGENDRLEVSLERSARPQDFAHSPTTSGKRINRNRLRLCYVAMTRARDLLVLAAAPSAGQERGCPIARGGHPNRAVTNTRGCGNKSSGTFTSSRHGTRNPNLASRNRFDPGGL